VSEVHDSFDPVAGVATTRAAMIYDFCVRTQPNPHALHIDDAVETHADRTRVAWVWSFRSALEISGNRDPNGSPAPSVDH
jgi:hypothetical protein